jgi:hypothetical protein
MTRSIAEIRAELEAAEKLEREQKLAQQNAVKPVYKFTIFPTPEQRFDRLFDDTMQLFTIKGECLNNDELEAVGKRAESSGQMKYLFNTATGKLVCSLGGGTSYIGNGFTKSDRDFEAEVMGYISTFLKLHSQGGDITHLINAHREAKRETWA